MVRRRSRISPAARCVNVTANTFVGATIPWSTRLAMRYVMVRVLPVPAPARMHTGPRGAVAATRWSSSNKLKSTAIGASFVLPS